MKLSKEQLATIDKSLSDLGVTFTDYKIEITDHIACEVEEIGTNKNVDFDVAFETVLKKWSHQLVKKSSFWLGQQHTFPKIIMQSIVQRVRKAQLITAIPLVLFLFFFVYFDVDDKLLNEHESTLKTIYFALFGMLTIVSIKLNYRSLKTSHRFLFNQSYILFLIFATLFIVLKEAGFLFCFYLLWMLTQVPFMLINAFLHARYIKKLSC